MSADVSFLLGYGGYCKMKLRAGANEPANVPFSTAGGSTVPLLSGNYDRSMQVPMQSTFSTPLDDSKRGKIRTGVGTYSYSGSMSFEITTDLCDTIFSDNFFKRRSFLDIEMCDGEGKLEIPGAVWSSFGIQADVGGVIQGNISFMSCNGYKHDIEVKDAKAMTSNLGDFSDLEPYWKYGGEGLQSFQLNFSRSITPVYLNEKHWIGPSYLRVGLMDVAFSVSCWEKWFEHNSIKLGAKTIKFNEESFFSNRGYQIAGINGEGMKTYTNNASGLKGDSELFTIS